MLLWTLFLLWIVCNAVDIAISWLAIQAGAIEVGYLYSLSGSWLTLVISKMFLALFIGGLLVYARKESWLALLTLGMAGICIYGGWVLLAQVSN